MLIAVMSTPQPVTATEADERIVVLQELVLLLQAQLQLLQSDSRVGVETAVAPFDPALLGRGRTVVVRYDGVTQATRADSNLRSIVERLLQLTPEMYQASLQGFIVYNDTTESSDALVVATEWRGETVWWFGVEKNLLTESITAAALDELLIHELGHVVLLEQGLAAPVVVDDCISLERLYGYCPGTQTIEVSYATAFWPPALRRAQMQGTVSQGRYDDWFVSEYATQNAAEDFAETFLAYLLAPDWMNTTTPVVRRKLAFVAALPAGKTFKTTLQVTGVTP